MYLLLLLPMALVSCGGDDEPKTNTTKDPDGTIVVNVNQGSETNAGGCGIKLGKDYNLRSDTYGGVSVIGPVKGIGSITATAASVQNLTWSPYAAAQVGYGYVFRQSVNIWDEAINQYVGGYSDYYAVYVAEEISSTTGGVMGYTLKVRKLLENIKEQD